jgi:ABC-type phosphate transport system substrate-binding protein
MKINKRLSLVPLLLSLAANAHAGAVVVASNSSIAGLDTEEIKKVFLGREPLLDGHGVVVVYQREGETRDQFDHKVLGRSGADLISYWSRLIFTGRALAPWQASSDNEVKSKLASMPGAIGYISDAAIDGSVKTLMRF